MLSIFLTKIEIFFMLRSISIKMNLFRKIKQQLAFVVDYTFILWMSGFESVWQSNHLDYFYVFKHQKTSFNNCIYDRLHFLLATVPKTIDSLWSPSLVRLSRPYCHLLGKINAKGTFSLPDIYDFHHGQPFWFKNKSLIEKNVPTALILTSRWQCGAESLPRDGAQWLFMLKR